MRLEEDREEERGGGGGKARGVAASGRRGRGAEARVGVAGEWRRTSRSSAEEGRRGSSAEEGRRTGSSGESRLAGRRKRSSEWEEKPMLNGMPSSTEP